MAQEKQRIFCVLSSFFSINNKAPNNPHHQFPSALGPTPQTFKPYPVASSNRNWRARFNQLLHYINVDLNDLGSIWL
jgi:hypothetical protein